MMSRNTIFFSLAALFLLMTGCHNNNPKQRDIRKNPETSFMGQDYPGSEPELFGPGIISTRRNERDFALSPDRKEVFYSYALPGFGLSVIIRMHHDGAFWSPPVVAWFSGAFNDLEPAFSPDGSTLFFVSRRPLDVNDSTNDWNIWKTDKKDGKWTAPLALKEPINGEGNEFYPSVADNGNLYFTAENKNDTQGGEDIYMARWTGSGYAQPLNLGTGVNSKHPEFNAFVAPDESYLIFSSWGREDGLGGGDLYISFRNGDGTWQEAVHMGQGINSDKLDYCPFVAAPGNLLFFTSQRLEAAITDGMKKTLDEVMGLEDQPMNGLGDIYWVAFDPAQWKQ